MKKMKRKTMKLLFATLAVATIWTGCKKDKDLVPVPQPVQNESEVITTMKLTFVDSSNISNIKYATFRDPDGDGGLGYDIFDTIRLEPNKTWITTIILLNETVSPADTISNEVLEEGVDHLFCFSPTGISATVIKTDLDANSLPIGLQSKWRTTATGLGTMQVELRHQPGIKDGSCTPGDTDIDVVFQTQIQ
ncbi:MAG: hypothetical protein EXR20_03885 [Bacteroidetes bacterium]|nr:hypothetical protein [Bacteroidota bacterium]